MTSNLRSPENLFFQTCLNYISLACSLCTEQFFLIGQYGFKMQGKWDIISDTKFYNVITGRYRKTFFLNMVILYIIWKVFHYWSFLTKRPWSENHPEKKYLKFSLTFSYKKIEGRKQEPLHCIYNFIIIHRSSLRTVEAKLNSFYQTRNHLYETKVTGVTKLVKYMSNISRRNTILVTKLAQGRIRYYIISFWCF